MVNEQVKKESLLRLRKIEGQLRGIQQMIEDERYCIDILTQISSATAALEQVSLIIMKRHLESCVTDAIRSGDEMDRQTKISELMDVFSRFGK
jgi:DNA-binding FrmR family transcriptional regulator